MRTILLQLIYYKIKKFLIFRRIYSNWELSIKEIQGKIFPFYKI